ncbi:MAG: alanine racemase [Pseudomonadota bacterium]
MSELAPQGSLTELTTPALLLDRDKLRANARRLANHISRLGGTLRPHMKTLKSIDAATDIFAAGSCSGITVSTLKEAEYFAEYGVNDIFYAVGISPNKFAQAAALTTKGVELTLTLDSVEMAQQLATFAEKKSLQFPVLIELDTDGHRSGTDPFGADLLAIGDVLERASGVVLRGVMTHAGESYNCRSDDEILAISRQERDHSIAAAQRLRAAGYESPVVSIGSTPTAFAIDDLTGVTEVRAGVYASFDLVMAGLGVCSQDQIALSVLVTITGYQKDKQWLITDGGWMAMSRDRGTASQSRDFGYGCVVDLEGNPLPLLMSGANQEHGILSPIEEDAAIDFSRFPLGSQLRILPNHACATAAQYGCFQVLEQGQLTGTWLRFGGW